MARVSGRMVKVCSIDSYNAECVWFDHRGQIHTATVDVAALASIWVTPKSMWPEINEMPDFVVAEMEARATQKRRERHRKPKASLKIKRRSEKSPKEAVDRGTLAPNGNASSVR
ncbi:hypothetical protein ACVWWI_003349 [Bradyrhizobium sp. USDA 3686]|uniref:hypothetical protein n=1 Tax=Bradyrhizobium canariense TaxID=255045 RepID=UPI00195D72D1|nr:hypothetical protein [Bradyrhizobium canariense]MBM7483335.1 hypothetical protein [Bradyrhizobium canariense]